MAIRRKRIDHKLDLTIEMGQVIDMSPNWFFTIDCQFHGKIYFDFTVYRERGRDNLAMHMRDAFWSLRHEVVGKTLKGYEPVGLRPFWRFLNDLDTAGEHIIRLDQIDRQLIDRFLVWMEMQVVTTGGRNNGQKWSIGSKKSIFSCLKTLLINRQKREPGAVSPLLSFPRNPFPNSNRLSPKRETYSAAEQTRILAALNVDLRTIHEGGDNSLSCLQVLVVHLLIFGMATGRNFQSLLDLKRDSLQEHPLPDREFLLTYKRRGWSTQATSLRKTSAPDAQQTLQTIPATVGEHFRFLLGFTNDLVENAAKVDCEYLFLWKVTHLARKGQISRLDSNNARHAITIFARRHALTDDKGIPLVLNGANLRPTFATELYRRTGDMRRVQQALGHSSIETTARHYVEKSLEADRNHAIVLDDMVQQFTRMEIEGKILIAADGKIPLQNLKDILDGGYNTGIARCSNPFREDESVCKKFFTCFRCPNMTVFEDDLWRLFSFYYRLLSERSKLNSNHWMKTFAPIVKRIDLDIAPNFPAEKVEAAKLKAQQSPHPTWRGPLL